MASVRSLVTTAGRLRRPDVGLVLPHEHVLADLRPLAAQEASAPPPQEAVVTLMAPLLRRAADVGVTVLVDATPVGVGRRPALVVAAARASGLPVVLPTGVYREPWIPESVRRADAGSLTAWMSRELGDGVDGTDVPAGWIKLSAGDDGMTATERRILRAAVPAALAHGAAVGSHTIRGRVVLDQLDVLDHAGFPADRFVAIHAQEESDASVTREIAERGAWLSFDGVGQGHDDRHVQALTDLAARGHLSRLLVSQDRGGYDPARPGGGEPLPYDHLVVTFLPMLRDAGWSTADVDRLTVDNPFDAFARPDDRSHP